MPPASLKASFPEELLERILEHAVIAPASPCPRAPWHPSPLSSQEKQTRSRIAPLLVSRAFHRIALLLFYHTIVLHSPRQSAALLQVLRARPFLARAVRTLVLPAPSREDAEVLSMLEKIEVLDVTLPTPNADVAAVDGLVAAIRDKSTLCALTVRKGAGTYLSQPAPRALLDAFADALRQCSELHTTILTFPLSTDPALARLISALAAAPALTTLRTPLPALWAPAYAMVAENPTLGRICLGDDLGSPSPSCSPSSASASPCPPSPSTPFCTPSPSSSPSPERHASYTSSPSAQYKHPLLPTALFLAAARPHTRLSELIRAGTDIAVGGWRGRAATVGAC